MRPFTVLIGIVLGSAASITFGLAAVLVVFGALAVVNPELWRARPDLGHELPRLVLSLLAFGVLTAASAGSFLGQAKGRSWRGWAHVATLGALAGITLWYWPHRA
jgi:hypothetical protein